MLTICARCRTPHDRRSVDAFAGTSGSSLCPACASGVLHHDRAAGLSLVTDVERDADVTVLPRAVLPVAS